MPVPSALGAIVMPFEWMNVIHQRVGRCRTRRDEQVEILEMGDRVSTQGNRRAAYFRRNRRLIRAPKPSSNMDTVPGSGIKMIVTSSIPRKMSEVPLSFQSCQRT